MVQIQPDMLSLDPSTLGRLNTKSLQEKVDEKAKLLVSTRYIITVYLTLALDLWFKFTWSANTFEAHS